MPPSYYEKSLETLRKLKQGSKSIKELVNKDKIDKYLEVFMEQFLFGLNQDIADEIEFCYYATIDDLLSLPIEAEKQQQYLAA
ncbi:hypothetical protein PIB30_083906, partial [Stylosanthes scabra]|nr:hypothetical protein [Stylosanthes scabra]